MIFPPDAHVAKAVALSATSVDAALLRAMRYVMPAHRLRAARLVSAAGAEFPFDVLIPAALAETLSDCDGEDDEGRVVGVRARSPVVAPPGEESGPPVLPPATQVAAPPPLSARGPDRGRAALDALLWQGMQELRDAYHVLAAERRPAPRPPPVVEALAPATERPSAGLNALALATQMEL